MGTASPFGGTNLPDPPEKLGSGRGLTATTAGMFLPTAGIFLVSVLAIWILWLVASIFVGSSDTMLTVLPLVWLFAGALMFVRPVEERIGHLLFGLRRPNSDELAHIQPLLERVCRKARVDHDRYILRIEDSADINASAAGGHIVAVTNTAVQLPESALEGIIAHEVGHHRDLHPVASGLGWWYSLPIVALDYVARATMRVTAFLNSLSDFVTGLLSGWLIFVGLAIGLALLFVIVLLWLGRIFFMALVLLANLCSSILSRAAEYAADRHATDLGYGPGLIALLRAFRDRGDDQPEARGRGVARIWNTHPPVSKRIDAIERRLADKQTRAADGGAPGAFAGD
jgi:Zn-dependent protease with chaperone function